VPSIGGEIQFTQNPNDSDWDPRLSKENIEVVETGCGNNRSQGCAERRSNFISLSQNPVTLQTVHPLMPSHQTKQDQKNLRPRALTKQVLFFTITP
jgi:hypothetical protein